MKLITLPMLFALLFATPSQAAAPSALDSAAATKSVSLDGWRTFPTAMQAHRYALVMQSRGCMTNVFYDPCQGCWVCEFFN